MSTDSRECTSMFVCILHKHGRSARVYSAEYFARLPSFTGVQAATIPISNHTGAIDAFRSHWPEYRMEGAALGTFMVSACAFGVLLGHPSSPAYQAIPSSAVRQILGGIAMGFTAVGIISSPWGQRSGAHMNPALTLTFLS